MVNLNSEATNFVFHSIFLEGRHADAALHFAKKHKGLRGDDIDAILRFFRRPLKRSPLFGLLPDEVRAQFDQYFTPEGISIRLTQELDQAQISKLPEIRDVFVRSLTSAPPLTLRFKSERDRDDAHRALVKGGSVPVPFIKTKLSPLGIRFERYVHLANLPELDAFAYEIQDEGSQCLAVGVLDPQWLKPLLFSSPTVAPTAPTQAPSIQLPPVIIDFCAGAGGKTLAISALLGGKGKLFAYDVDDKKIAALRKRAKEQGETNIKTLLIPRDLPAQTEALTHHAGKADVVYCDIPCSGWGVVRRNPDLLWPKLMKRQTAQTTPQLPIEELQRNISKGALPLVKSGGRFIVSTCTFSPQETTHLHRWIEQQSPQLQLEAEGFLGPYGEYSTDIFSFASWRKID